MHLHILGICGTFMGGIARLAIEKGFRVTGSDQNCYPPMSDQLEALGINLHQGYDAAPLKDNPDSVIVGNAMMRGHPVIEELLDSNQIFTSGPEWLKHNILHDKWVIAVAGTHGKTTTASMITWILEATGYNPGFLIGGVMENFGVSARNTDSAFFVVEADEYDTAFFDKRSKFVHYRARTCVLNNLEFDHADIFDDLGAIETQFHHLVRTIPHNGLVIRPSHCDAIDRVIKRGCWTPVENFSVDQNKEATWQVNKLSADGSQAEIFYQGESCGILNWGLIGDHNIANALAAISAAHHVGVTVKDAILALASFKNVKRRMELRGEADGICVYDDFAHHPTAIELTIEGLKNKKPDSRIIAVIDPRSNTMRMGGHQERLIDSVKNADQTIFHIPSHYQWDLDVSQQSNIDSVDSVDQLIINLLTILRPTDQVLIMSNGSFDDIHNKLLTQLNQRVNIKKQVNSQEGAQ